MFIAFFSLHSLVFSPHRRPYLMPVSSFSCCLVRATVSCVSSSAHRLILLQLFWRPCIIFSRTPGVLASYSSEPLVSFLVSIFFLRSGLVRFVVLLCPVRRHFTCFTLINHCDCLAYPASHIFCMYVSTMNNKHGRRVYSTHTTINLLVILPAELQFFSFNILGRLGVV